MVDEAWRELSQGCNNYVPGRDAAVYWTRDRRPADITLTYPIEHARDVGRRAKSLITALLCVLFTCAAATDKARAEHFALLIGVSDYQNEKLKLKGPRNDIPSIWNLLRERGFKSENIYVLADSLAPSPTGPQSTVLPTHDNILRYFDKLVDGLSKDDLLFVYFSGHGTTMPQNIKGKTDIKPDGLDDVFLPIDIGQWDPKIGSYDNGLIDDEIKERVLRSPASPSSCMDRVRRVQLWTHGSRCGKRSDAALCRSHSLGTTD